MMQIISHSFKLHLFLVFQESTKTFFSAFFSAKH